MPADDHLNFIVHNFITGRVPATPLPTQSAIAILDVGRQTIQHACGSNGWFDVDLDFDESLFSEFVT